MLCPFRLCHGAFGVLLLQTLLVATGCGEQSNTQQNEGAKCEKGARLCEDNVMRVCNPSQSGWNEFSCASNESCTNGLAYGMCAEDVKNAGAIECQAPTADCNSNLADGCETNLGTSTKNCGACGTECSSINGTARCVAGQCQVDCTQGFANCNGKSDDGCEVSLLTDKTNCGTCGIRCSDTNGSFTCENGSCQVSTCHTGYGDCDGNPATGCETIPHTNAEHCGGCNQACRNSHGTVSCNAGHCDPTCEAGYANCDGDPNNGCETDTRSTPTHCGGCGKICEGGTRAVCVAGLCDLACETGKGDCDGDRSNGCETDTTANLAHCGACATACTNAHGTTTCAASKCVPTCQESYSDCDGNPANGCETATDTSLDHCGGCGKICSGKNGTANCSSGSCSVTCSANYSDCNSDVSDGCEAYLPGDPKHCGTCGTSCNGTGGTATCSLGVCGVTCDAQHANCDSALTNGCEVDLTKDKNNCGGCGNVCSAANGTAECSSGICSLTCAVGYKDCDKDSTNGCEVHLTDDGKNCGTCGHSCLGGTCALGVCGSFVLASGQARPSALAVDSTGVYWINEGSSTSDGAVMRLEHGSSTPVALATGQAQPCDIAVTDTVFWTNRVRDAERKSGGGTDCARVRAGYTVPNSGQ